VHETKKGVEGRSITLPGRVSLALLRTTPQARHDNVRADLAVSAKHTPTGDSYAPFMIKPGHGWSRSSRAKVVAFPEIAIKSMHNSF
jgi:hypothetical protein